MASEKAIYDYKGVLADFSDEIQEWLMDIYLEHGHQVEKRLKNILKDHPEYLLAVSDEDYQSIASKVLPILLKKLSYINYDDEKLYDLFKQIRVKFSTWTELTSINESFDKWIDETKNKYGVDLAIFADVYVSWWERQEKLWEKRCKVYSKEWDTYYYDWRLAKDPFGIDDFYVANQYRPFFEGHKRDLEMLFVYMNSAEPWFKWQESALKDYIKKFEKSGKKETVFCKEATAHELGTRWKSLINAQPNDANLKMLKYECINGNIDGTMRTFIAVSGDKIIGDVTLKSENSEILALRIDPEYQGHKIATQLIKYVEKWAIRNGVKYLQICVKPNQVHSMQIFFHWGFDEFILNDNSGLTYQKNLNQ